MSKEVAAAILTKIYFENVSGAKTGLYAHPAETGISPESVDAIGRVYSGFLGRHHLFQQWAFKNSGGTEDTSVSYPE